MDKDNQEKKEREIKESDKGVVRIIVAIFTALILYSILNAVIDVYLNQRIIKEENERHGIALYQMNLFYETQNLSEYKGKVDEINILYLAEIIDQEEAINQLREIMDEIDKMYPGFKEDVFGEIAQEEYYDLSENVYTLQITIKAQIDYRIDVIMSQTTC